MIIPASPSTQQAAVCEFIRTGKGSGIVKAGPGTGKTTLLVQAFNGASSLLSMLVIAFNKATVDELKVKMPNLVACKTFHGIGMQCLYQRLGSSDDRPIKVDGQKYYQLCFEAVRPIHEEWVELFEDEAKRCCEEEMSFPRPPSIPQLAQDLRQIVALSVEHLIDIQSGEAIHGLMVRFRLAAEYPLWVQEALSKSVEPVLLVGEHYAQEDKWIDFIDQIWLISKWDLRPKQYMLVGVDETQDLSPARTEILMKSVKPRIGRVLAVGDPNQSIYLFAGAAPDAYWKVKERLNAQEFPLSVCYRCASNIVRLAQMLVPDLSPAPGAGEGTVALLEPKAVSLPKLVKSGDFILSRRTSPLVEQCLKLIASGIPARVRGRNIADSLISLAQQLASMKGFSYAALPACLEAFLDRQIMRLVKANAHEEINRLSDRAQGLLACYHGLPRAKSIEQLCEAISSLFPATEDDSDAPFEGVDLMTAHRAKSLEADRVFIINPEDLPMQWDGQTDEESEQEMNLLFVAITRAKRELYFYGQSLPEPLSGFDPENAFISENVYETTQTSLSEARRAESKRQLPARSR